MNTCGAIRQSGRSQPLKVTRFSMRGVRGRLPAPVQPSVAGALEPAQKLVATLDGRVERRLRVLVAGPHGLELFVDDAADLVEGAKAQALGIGGRRVRSHLLHRHVGAGVLLVEALLTGQLA